MLSFASIQEEVARQSRKAKAENKKPASVRNFDPSRPLSFLRSLPFLGTYIPEGWEDTGFDTLFVDGTGLDNSGPALSLSQFSKKVFDLKRSTPDHFGIAIVEAGEFQVVVKVYRTDSRDFTHSGELTEADLRQVGRK